MSFPRMHDVGAYVKPVAGINPTDSAAATINGSAIDRQGFQSCVLMVMAGAASGGPTAQTVDAKLQESDNGTSGWADVSGAAVTTVSADNSSAEVDVDLATVKRYVRVVVTVGFTGGTSPTIPVASTVVLGGSDTLPQ